DTYSVAQYANRIIENEDGEFDDLFPTDNTKLSKLQELAKSMLHYGAEAQKYFDHNTDALADSSLSGYTPAEIDTEQLSTHTYGDEEFSTYGLTYSGNSLLLKDTTTLRVFFTPDDNYDGTKVYYGDTELAAGTRGKYVYFDIVGIKTADILNDRTLTFKKSDNSQNVTFNISDYIADMKDKDSTRDILKALYDYNRRAVAFFG
ncbi:MAG: hypothetical protein IJ639_01645, partial [Ruminococcus sp.]|nr:hypothetical protein [Ruminococcus sp.]